MSETFSSDFVCHMYVSAKGAMDFVLPAESGPKRVIRFEPMPHDELVKADFRQLLAAFESVTFGNKRSLQKTVQV